MNKGIFILALATFVAGTVEFIIAGLLDMIAKDLNTSIGAVGQLVSIYSIVFAFGAPIFVALTSKMERRKLLIIAMGVFLVGNIISIFSPDFTVLLIARIILAASCSIVIIVSLTTAANSVTPELRGRAMGIIFMGISASLVLGVPLGTLIGGHFGWRMTFVLVAALSIISLIGIIKFLPTVPPQPPIPLIKQLATLKNKQVVSIHVISFFMFTGHFTIYTYMIPFLKETMALPTNTITFVLACFGAAGIVGGWIGGWSSDKLGESKTILVALLLFAITLFILPFATNSLFTILLIIIPWGILSWAISPSVQGLLAKSAPRSADIQIGLNNSFTHLGIASGSGFGGVLVNHYSVSTNTWVAGLFLSVAFLLTVYTVKKTKEAENFSHLMVQGENKAVR